MSEPSHVTVDRFDRETNEAMIRRAVDMERLAIQTHDWGFAAHAHALFQLGCKQEVERLRAKAVRMEAGTWGTFALWETPR